jgi:hypothetical protein
VKTLTCRDLGGPCDQKISGNSFGEIGDKCKTHVVEQISKGDKAHRDAADKMGNASPKEQQAMMAEYEKKYNDAPNT